MTLKYGPSMLIKVKLKQAQRAAERSDSPRPGPSRLPRDSSPRPGPSRLTRDSSPRPGPSRQPRDSSPRPGPSRQTRASSPRPGPSRQPRDNSPQPGPSGLQQRSAVQVQGLRRQRHEISSSSSEDEEESEMAYTHLYHNEERVFENNDFYASLRQIDHRRETRFHLSDHLFEMKIHAKTERPATIEGLFEILNSAIMQSVSSLQRLYNNDFRRQLYCTVIDNSINHGLNSGNFDIRTPADAIAGTMLEMLENFLLSNQDLELNNSFKVQFKVLSVAHYGHNIQNVPNFVPHIVGSSKKTTYPNYVTIPPEYCYYHKSGCFAKLCFLVSFVIGWIKIESEELEKFSTFLEFRKSLFHRYEKHRKSAHQKIHTYIEQLYQNGLERGKERNLNYLIPFLSEKYNIQFHLFDEITDFSLKQSFPDIISYEMRQMFLCYFGNNHITLVNNLNQLFAKNKNFYCFSCQKYFTRKVGHRHLCKKHKSCFACGRLVRKPTYFVTHQNGFSFCSDAQGMISCFACKRTCQNEECLKEHRKICQKGVMFHCCNSFEYVSGERPNVQFIKNNHTCIKKCRQCQKDITSKHHQCKFGQIQLNFDQPKIGYFHFLNENMSGASCFKCSKKVCNIHTKGKSIEPACFGLMLPYSYATYSFSFCSKYDNLDETILRPIEPKNYHKFDEKLHCLASVPKLSHLRNQDMRSLNLLDKILRCIIDKKIFNVILCCCDKTNTSMQFILQMLFNNGLTPKISHHQNQIRLISLPGLKIKFINLINFLPRDAWGVNAIFPVLHIHKTSILSNFFPDMDDLLEIDDDDLTISMKRAHYSQLNKYTWNFARELKGYMNNVLSEIFEKTSHFLSDCWAFQTLAFQYYKSPFKFYHPFSESVTKTSYFFKLFQHLELNYSNLFSIKYESTGVPFKSSSTEYIFTSYLKYCNPQNNIVDSFSPHGQPRLRHLIPDAIDFTTGTVYFFHGCYFHRHPCKKTKFKAGDFLKEEEKFNEKKEKFMKIYQEFKNIKIVWECDFLNQMKSDSHLRDFCCKLPKRPMHRLIARDARKYPPDKKHFASLVDHNIAGRTEDFLIPFFHTYYVLHAEYL